MERIAVEKSMILLEYSIIQCVYAFIRIMN